jgi:hypothetical protein
MPTWESVWNTSKHTAATIGVLSILMGASVAVIKFFGGHVPPWPDTAWAEGTNKKIDSLTVTVGLMKRDEIAAKLEKTQKELVKNPDSEMLQQDRDKLQWELRVQDKALESLTGVTR